MTIPDKEYDFVIIGSGLGGLACGFILANEGYSVIILEKNQQIGGCLQVFSRDKSIFDTGVHYIGGLDKNENLYQFFKYFGLIGKLKLKRLDDDAFDIIQFRNNEKYAHAQGYDKFSSTLKKSFPGEEKAIDEYCSMLKKVCNEFPLYNLDISREHFFISNPELYELNAFDYIASLTSNKKLQNVLAGSNPLYAGIKEKTPFYVHALIMNSYLSGAYRLVDGGSQIATELSKSIRKKNGEIYKRKKIVSAEFDSQGNVACVVTNQGEKIRGKKFISNIHPMQTIKLFGENRFVKVYRNRILNLENSISGFIVHIAFKKDAFPYLNHNIYYHDSDDVWDSINVNADKWPEGFFICTPATTKSDVYADSMGVMAYMKMEDLDEWKDSFNNVVEPSDRGRSYAAFKKEKEELVLKKLETVFPGIGNCIKSVHSSTPLTFRDFLGTEDGSLYGIIKNSHSILKSMIYPRTKIPNLYLTGQNIILHGILGVTIGAFVTCFEFVDKKCLLEKVRNS